MVNLFQLVEVLFICLTSVRSFCENHKHLKLSRGTKRLVLSEKNSTCPNNMFIFENILIKKAEVLQIHYRCTPQTTWWGGRFVFITLPHEKAVCTDRWDKEQTSDCFTYVRKSSKRRCKSTLNDSKCTAITLNDKEWIRITTWKTTFLKFKIWFTSKSCGGYKIEDEGSSRKRLYNTSRTLVSVGVVDEKKSTSSFLPVTTKATTPSTDEGTQPQSGSHNKFPLEIPLAVVSALLVISIAFGVGFTCLRKQSQTNNNSEITDSTISPYAETTVTSPDGHENSTIIKEADHSSVTLRDICYIDPENVPARHHHANYVNQFGPTKAEAILDSVTGGDYLRPIERQFITEASGYESSIYQQVDDNGYLELTVQHDT